MYNSSNNATPQPRRVADKHKESLTRPRFDKSISGRRILARRQSKSMISRPSVDAIVTVLSGARQEGVLQRFVCGNALRRVKLKTALHELDCLKFLLG
jgi:hypothetical protein